MPSASMGLSTPCGIYQARFIKYLESRGLKPKDNGKVWVFIGDGESDEPEVIGTINIASRENLDNLVLVINCNLQRLDGPVRGNGKIIQELERRFRGADWHVLKVIWGGGWDPILERDREGILQHRMEEAVDGDYQMYTVSPGDVVREHWVENTPKLRDLMKSLTDEEIRTIRRGGHDQKKIYAAYVRAREVRGKPCVILIKTVKGDGLGPSSEGRNTVHQKKYLTPDERHELAKNFGIPLTSEEIDEASLYRPSEDSEEIKYLLNRREELGGFVPQRHAHFKEIEPPPLEFFNDMLAGTGNRTISTTMAVVRMLQRLLRHEQLGKYIVPIVPDEARTFGMDGLFPQAGIYSPEGQHYQPVDAGTIAPYRESVDGQILQEGICETGAMASFLAAGTAYSTHGLPMVPFYIFYSMFGFQRVGDMIWACGDMLCKGFLLGGTSGRTTLNGEGVQHQDGHSHLMAATVPNLISYDPAFAYEIAVIVREGIRRMYTEQEDIFYYLTVTNQNYVMPPMPEGIEDGIVQGMYAFRYTTEAEVNLLGSGAIMVEVIAAADELEAMGKTVSIWSVTSYNELARQGIRSEREGMLKVGEEVEPPYVSKALGNETRHLRRRNGLYEKSAYVDRTLGSGRINGAWHRRIRSIRIPRGSSRSFRSLAPVDCILRVVFLGTCQSRHRCRCIYLRRISAIGSDQGADVLATLCDRDFNVHGPWRRSCPSTDRCAEPDLRRSLQRLLLLPDLPLSDFLSNARPTRESHTHWAQPHYT